MLGNRVNDLEARLATQGELLAEREFENNQLRQAKETAERTAQALQDELSTANNGRSPALEKLKAEKAAAEEQLRVARDDAPSCNATSTRSSSRPKARGRPSASKMRCCASASTISPPKWPNSRCSSKARIRRSRPCWPRNRRRRRGRSPPMAPAPIPAFPRAAARWPSGSGRCSPTPPAPASRADHSFR